MWHVSVKDCKCVPYLELFRFIDFLNLHIFLKSSNSGAKL